MQRVTTIATITAAYRAITTHTHTIIQVAPTTPQATIAPPIRLFLATSNQAIIIAINITLPRSITTLHTITLQTVHQVTTTIRLHMVAILPMIAILPMEAIIPMVAILLMVAILPMIVTLPTITAQLPMVAIRPTRAQVVITKTSKL